MNGLGWAFLALLTVALVPFFFWLFNISNSLNGGMDSYNHYLISRFSWEHPRLLLDQWGKPVYTILASPFARFGLKGLLAFNLLCLIGSAFLTAFSAKNLKLKQPWLAGVLMLLSPLFLDHIISGLTEPLNALFVSLILFALTSKRFYMAAIVAGFLPFVRSEGFVLITPIFFYFLYHKKHKEILGLLVVPFLFNLLGWYIKGQPLWIFTDNPYLKFQASGEVICGSGTWWHYLRWSPVIFGRLIVVFALISFVLWLVSIKQEGLQRIFSLKGLILIGVPALFIAVHSFIWWRGMMGSCGYIRVMIIISPFMVLLAFGAIDYLLGLNPYPKSNILMVVGIVGISLYAPYKYFAYRYPVEKSHEQVAFEQVHQFLKSNDLLNRKMYFLYPYLNILNDSDPYNIEEHTDLWSFDKTYMKEKELVIWDTHFGPNEANIELESLLHDKRFKQIYYTKTFHFDPNLRHSPMEVYVFEINRLD